MRSLFIVACKVCGLMQVYTGLTYIFTVLPMLRMLTAQPESGDAVTTMSTVFHGEQVTLSFISLSTMVMLTFGIAWLLLFRANWLADKLNIPTSDGPPCPSMETLLHAGTKLIGLFVVVQGTPLLVQGLCQVPHLMPFRRYMWSPMILAITRITIGVILVLKTRLIVQYIMREERQKRVGGSD